jgi:type I restriction-modification system DNA methylase subunit
MSEEQRRQLQQQLWNIANTLRGRMAADDFRDYILGFIFYKYLSEKIQRFADSELLQEGLKFADIDETTADIISVRVDQKTAKKALNSVNNNNRFFLHSGTS